jgi:hypothetical protein
MTRFRFSLLSLAGATAVIGVACASLVNASDLVSRLVWGATLLCLTFALLCALLAAPARRGFWVGFAVVGWLYVLFTYGPLSDLANVTSFDPLLKVAAEAMPQAKQRQSVTIAVDPSESYSIAAERFFLGIDAGQGTSPKAVDGALRFLSVQARAAANTEFIESFVRISHAFIALLLAIVGGVSGHFIRRRSSPVASATA